MTVTFSTGREHKLICSPHLESLCIVFLPLDAVYWCEICYSDVDVCLCVCVCVFVCVSITLMYCAQTIESITMQPSRDCSPAILVFP